jgi:hypothetical protein
MGEQQEVKYNGEIPHLAELSNDCIVKFRKNRLAYINHCIAANRGKSAAARTNIMTIAECMDVNLLQEVKEDELDLTGEENAAEIDEKLNHSV